MDLFYETCSEVCTRLLFAMVRTHFNTAICVFRMDSTIEYPSETLRQVRSKHGTLARFSCPNLMLIMGLLNKSNVVFFRPLMLLFLHPLFLLS
jgi:hypothetical protein